MSLFKKALMLMLAVSLTAGVFGCKKEGAGERAGKAVDKALDDAKKKLDDVTK
ncbi:MAG: hypothetical protein Q7U10_11690 [Thermodesulfovibrionia bacterium]|nr:hypothetical protein [Thermodesulfovibrionia bacterium]